MTVLGKLDRNAEAIKLGLGTDIGFLTVDVPIAQLVDWDGRPSDGAAHERAGADDTEVAIEKLNLGLTSR
jgi:hypothetical protein